jgi:hypothetical protein
MRFMRSDILGDSQGFAVMPPARTQVSQREKGTVEHGSTVLTRFSNH